MRSPRERASSPNAGCKSRSRSKVRAAGGEVGAVHSSATATSRPAMREEGGNVARAKGPHLIDGDSEAVDEAMAPMTEIETPSKVQQLQRSDDSLPSG